MSRKKPDPAVDVVRIVSLLASKRDYSGIADGEDTPLGALVDAILFAEDGKPQMSDEQIAAVFVAIVRSVPPNVLAKMRAAAVGQEAYVTKYAREDAEDLLRAVSA